MYSGMEYQLKMISTKNMTIRTMWMISNARSADESNAAILISSENSEYNAKIVIKIWKPKLCITCLTFFALGFSCYFSLSLFEWSWKNISVVPWIESYNYIFRTYFTWLVRWWCASTIRNKLLYNREFFSLFLLRFLLAFYLISFHNTILKSYK